MSAPAILVRLLSPKEIERSMRLNGLPNGVAYHNCPDAVAVIVGVEAGQIRVCAIAVMKSVNHGDDFFLNSHAIKHQHASFEKLRCDLAVKAAISILGKNTGKSFGMPAALMELLEGREQLVKRSSGRVLDGESFFFL